jgi:hypothetical protein
VVVVGDHVGVRQDLLGADPFAAPQAGRSGKPSGCLRIQCIFLGVSVTAPGSPHHRSVSISFVAVITIAACSGAPAVPPTGPSSQVVAPPPSSTRTVTGSVWLYSSPTASQPLAGRNVGIWLEQSRSSGGGGSPKSDSAGRFSFEAPSDALVRLTGGGPPGLYQPCLSTVRVDQTEATIRLVAESHILQARDWPDFMVERMLSGTIFEASPTGRLPISDAWIEVDGVYGDGLPLAHTKSDANGRFVACGLEGNPIHALVVAKSGYQLAVAMLPTEGAGPLDVELRVCAAGQPRLSGGWCY